MSDRPPPAPGNGPPRRPHAERLVGRLWEEVARAFDEFLALPTAIIAAFIALAIATYFLDADAVAPLTPARQGLQRLIFASPEAAPELLGVIATSLITVASITFSVVLLAVQQAAGSLTSSVLEQFLRRRINQVAFGFFSGLALYALIVLATATDDHVPVLGGALALVLTAASLYLLLLFLYTTVNQILPEEIGRVIHDHVLAARRHQLGLVRRTRRRPLSDSAAARTRVYADQHGYLARIDLDGLEAAREACGAAEVFLLPSIGRFVAFGDPLAEIAGARDPDDARLHDALRRALRLERQRNLRTDPTYGIEQLANIGWTSISSSKSDPEPGLQVIRDLRDVLSRWAAAEMQPNGTPGAPDDVDTSARVVAVVYVDDTHGRLLDALESLAVVSTESMQHQSFAEVVNALAATFDRLTPPLQQRIEDLVRRILTGLGDHILTADVDAALAELTRTLTAAGRTDTASAVHAAHAAMRASLGAAHSRSDRLATRD